MIPQDVSDILRQAYGSILDRKGWPDVLDRLVEILDGRAAVLVVQEHAARFAGFNALSHVYRDLHKDLFDHYNIHLAQDEAPAWQRLMEKAPGEVYFDTELVEDVSRLDAQEHYRFAREHFDIGRRIAFRLNDNRGWFDGVAIGYHAEWQAVPSSVATPVGVLAPHLARAVELSRAFSILHARYRAVVSALDQLGLGVAIVTGSAEAIVCNEAALSILDRTTLVRISRDGRLVCTDPDFEGHLQEAVCRAAATAAGRDRVLTAPLRLQGAGSEDEILLDVSPLADAGGEIDRGLSGAVVFLIDTAHPPKLDETRFARLYGLTGAETEVLSGLIAGRLLAEIAEDRGTSLNTARNQAQSILAKTGCANRSDILRLIMRTLPPITGTRGR